LRVSRKRQDGFVPFFFQGLGENGSHTRARKTLSRNYIWPKNTFQNIHLLEITFAQTYTFQKVHLPEHTF